MPALSTALLENTLVPPEPVPDLLLCSDCGTTIPRLALLCPQCGRLTYTERLQQLAAGAKALEAAGEFEQAGQQWRQALILLPGESGQALTIQNHLADTDLRQAGHIEQKELAEEKASFLKRFTGPFAIAGGFLWKFKAALLIFWTKGKFLLFGLTKLKTLLSALAYVGLYWAWFGWKYAAGFVLGIYVHEMGHAWVMRRYGLRPTAPMFIPGFGAFVATYKAPASVHESARIGLAGPMWGLGSVVVCAAAAIFTSEPIWRALAQSLAFVNLLNLIPVWILDGHFAFAALTKPQRSMIGATALAMFFATGVGVNALLVLGVLYKVFIVKDHAERPDWRVAIEMAGLIVTLSILASIPAERPGSL